MVRIFLGTVIAAHGAQKLLGWFGGYGFEGSIVFFTQTIGLPYLFAVVIILAESVGMVALILGLFGRFMAASLIIIMLGAIFAVQGQFGFFMNWFGNQGGEGIEFSLLTITLASVVLLNGSGIYSIDDVLLKKIHVNEIKRTSLV